MVRLSGSSKHICGRYPQELICGSCFILESSFILTTTQEEFGYHHPHGGLTIPWKEGAFINLDLNVG
ncbi:hypothetical protein IC582_025036 [Cucumis melo]